MFCPKCSQPQPAEDLRYCPRCGFPVREVKELVGREEAGDDDEALARKQGRLPAQKDVAAGAALMFAGGVVSVLWGHLGSGWPAGVLLPQVYFVLGLSLVFLLTLFHPLLRALEKLVSGGESSPSAPRRRDGFNLGALLMFAGTLKAMLASSVLLTLNARTLTTLLLMAGMLLLLLLLNPLLRFAHGLFFKRDRGADSAPAGATARLDSAGRGAALPHARAVPVEDFTRKRADTAELVAPPSVTEETTRKLT